MSVTSSTRNRQTGESLLEVAIALGITALALLGAMSSQVVAVRTEKGAAQRELASLIAASAADALRNRPGSTSGIDYWRTQAMQALPSGEIAVHDAIGGAGFVAVRWAHWPTGVEARTTRFNGCPREFAMPERSCSVAPYFRGIEP